MALNNYHRGGIAALALSAAGLVHISMQEGYTEVAVRPVPGDVPTMGFGTTAGVKMGDKTTPPKALQRELTDISKFEDAIKACVHAPLYQREYDAYVSLAYNIGPAAFCKSSIPQKLNTGDYAAACETILQFDKFHGQPMHGLTVRRQSEYRMCAGPQT